MKVCGEYRSLSDIFDQYYNPLVLHAHFYIPEIEECEDLVQDLMATLLLNKKEFTNEKNLKGYLYTSIKNKALNIIRSHKLNEKYVAYTERFESDGDNLMDTIIEKEVHSIIHNAINLLPGRCREVFKLIVFESLSYEEAAEKLQVSVNTIKTQRSRAVKILKENLEKHFYFLHILLSGK